MVILLTGAWVLGLLVVLLMAALPLLEYVADQA
jgi:hypothetical protein